MKTLTWSRYSEAYRARGRQTAHIERALEELKQ